MRPAPRACTVLAALFIAATFAFRSGVPGFRHDWIWPQDARAFPALFAGGLSAFSPHGYGGGGGTPSVNVALLCFALLGALGVSSAGVLFTFVFACLLCAQIATEELLRAIEPTLGTRERALTAACYAFGPVLFQKLVAGHVYYVLAYALLPLLVRFAWDGTRQERLAPFLAAGLAIAASSGQLQFLCFDALVVLVVVAQRPRCRTLSYAACAIAIGLLHNGNAVAAALGASPGVSLERFQATLQWETDQSTLPVDLASLGGYIGYDRAALAAPLLDVYAAARLLLAALACVSLLRLRGPRRAAVLVFSALALVALSVASGVYGPFSALIPTLIHSPLFALARELWHITALYALALVVLAALGLGVLPARMRLAGCACAALVTLPFFTLGLPREVPALAANAFLTPAATRADGERGFIAERPFAEPLALATVPASAGIDPARLQDDVLSAGDPPPVVRRALLAPHPDRALLADLGIAAIRTRPALVSRLGASFEPNVGADSAAWNTNEARLQRSPEMRIARVRPQLALEEPGMRGALDATLADAALPGGVRVPLASSYVDNNVDRSWVSGRGWWWRFPAYESLTSDPVLTRGTQPYGLGLPRGRTSTIDVLLAGGEPQIDGVRGRPLGRAGDGPYAWWRWERVAGTAMLVVGPPGRRVRAVAAVIADAAPRWRPPLGARARAAQTLAASVPGSGDDAVLPPSGHPRYLVLARAYSPDRYLHLVAERRDLPPVRLHGLFTGWLIPPSQAPLHVRVTDASARRTQALIALPSGIESLLLCGFALVSLRRRRTATLR